MLILNLIFIIISLIIFFIMKKYSLKCRLIISILSFILMTIMSILFINNIIKKDYNSNDKTLIDINEWEDKYNK